MNTQDTSLFSSQPPYFKEGVVLRKHLLESASQKAKHREWKECFLEVGSHGELRMYSLQNNPNEDRRTGFRHSNLYLDLSDRSNRQQNSLSFGGVVENGKWGVSTVTVYVYKQLIPVFFFLYSRHIHS
jgi:hypothetical protein